MSAGASALAGALAAATVHGPVAGIAPAMITERDGVTFTVRCCWPFRDGNGSVSVQEKGDTLDAAHGNVAAGILRVWPELEALA